MGISFVIFFHLIALFLLSTTIAVIGAILIYFIIKKGKRKLIFVSIAPFVGLFTLYFCSLIGSVIVSEIKNVDIGIGDSWYIPLNNNCELLFIDLPEQAILVNKKETIISGIIKIEQDNNIIIGKNHNGKYFSYNTQTNELRNFNSEKDLIILNPHRKKLQDVYGFYY